MSTERTAPDRWILFTDDGNAVAVMPAGRPGDICVIDRKQIEANANAAFIVLADHHFDKLEAALREMKTALNRHNINDTGKCGWNFVSALNKADAVLAAIDAERGK